METHDFTAAKVGDKVSHPIYGNGVIHSMTESPSTAQPADDPPF